jgi:hypothetical protein
MEFRYYIMVIILLCEKIMPSVLAVLQYHKRAAHATSSRLLRGKRKLKLT